MWSRWLVTVRIEMNSRAPISRFVRPSATSSATSSSRDVKVPSAARAQFACTPGRGDRLDARHEPHRACLTGDLEGGAEARAVDRSEVGLGCVDRSLGLLEASSEAVENVGGAQQLDCRISRR